MMRPQGAGPGTVVPATPAAPPKPMLFMQTSGYIDKMVFIIMNSDGNPSVP